MLHTSHGWLHPNSVAGGRRYFDNVERIVVTLNSLTQYDLRRPIVTRRDNNRVVFIVKGGRAKVNQPYCSVIDSLFVALLYRKKQMHDIVGCYAVILIFGVLDGGFIRLTTLQQGKAYKSCKFSSRNINFFANVCFILERKFFTFVFNWFCVTGCCTLYVKLGHFQLEVNTLKNSFCSGILQM